MFFLLLTSALAKPPTWSYLEEAVPETLDPRTAATPAERRAIGLVFERLVYTSGIDGPGQSRVLASWIQEDNTITMTLRDDRHWHDGQLMVPGDVCASARLTSWVTACTEGAARSVALTVDDATTRDPLGFWLLPAHDLDRDDFGVTPIGSGPMRVQRQRGKLIFTAFKEVNPSGPQRLDLVEGGPPEVAVTLLERGSAHGMPAIPASEESRVPSTIALLRDDPPAWWFVALNTKRLSDPRVREALEHALEPNTLHDTLMEPDSTRMTGPFLPDSDLVNKGVEPIETNKSVIRPLMESAGNARAGSATASHWTREGKPLKLTVGLDSRLVAENPQLLPEVSGRLQRAGFQVEVWKLSEADWTHTAEAGGYAEDVDLLIGQWRIPEASVRDIFHSEGTRNLFGYRNSEVDGLLDSLRTAEDFDRRAIAWELQGVLASDRPYLFLWTAPRVSAWDRRIKARIGPVDYFSDIEKWDVVR